MMEVEEGGGSSRIRVWMSWQGRKAPRDLDHRIASSKSQTRPNCHSDSQGHFSKRARMEAMPPSGQGIRFDKGCIDTQSLGHRIADTHFADQPHWTRASDASDSPIQFRPPIRMGKIAIEMVHRGAKAESSRCTPSSHGLISKPNEGQDQRFARAFFKKGEKMMRMKMREIDGWSVSDSVVRAKGEVWIRYGW